MRTAAFLLSTVIGFLIGHYLLPGATGVFVSMLLSYHLFLAFLVIIADHEKGLSLPVGSTILTHLACLAVLVGVAIGRQHIPFFFLLKFFVPALAPFEAEWLFSGGRKKKVPAATKPEPIPMPEGIADDYEEFLRYLSQKNRSFSKPGRSVREEHVLWTADRARKLAARQFLQAQRQAAVSAMRSLPEAAPE
jgi:hypothetical protein